MSAAAKALLQKLMYTETLGERVGGIDADDVLAGKELFDNAKPYGSTIGKTMLANIRSNPVRQDRIDPADEYRQAVRFFVKP